MGQKTFKKLRRAARRMSLFREHFALPTPKGYEAPERLPTDVSHYVEMDTKSNLFEIRNNLSSERGTYRWLKKHVPKGKIIP